MRVVHVVLGPEQHGIVRHARQVARACQHEMVCAATVDEAVAGVGVTGAEVVHVPFGDRLFAATAEAAAEAFGRVAEAVAACGAVLTTTLHDVPDPAADGDWHRRRTTAYARVIAAAEAVVVNSTTDLAAVEDAAARRPGPRLLRRIELPVDPVVTTPAPPADRDVAVLGFVYPDRGYEEVLAALPPGSGLVALGRASAGHEQLPHELADAAHRLGRAFRVTGWCPDGELAARLATVAVPVAPNRRVTSSGSIGTWLAHGRRPLVPATPYTRELAARLPGTLELYDDGPSLTAAVEAALDDPARTWLAPGTATGPDTAAVAAEYHLLFEQAAPWRARAQPVPRNRWDLLAPATADPSISVVIPYHRAQAELDRVLTALTLQTVRVEVIVADDGSPVAPDVTAAGGLPVRVVRQERRGFGAARARNLGLAHATGDVVAFLDGDTVPEPTYCERLAALPATGADVFAVGRRRHAELDGFAPAAVRDWLRGTGPAPVELPAPRWLTDGYGRSRDLLDADARSYRYVISAVLAANRDLLLRLGGFDERFDHYGGEDWELAHRAWTAGALLAHVPGAVAWHHGGDWAARDASATERAAAKNRETATLARLLPDPAARGGGQWLPYPHTVVLLGEQDPVGVLACTRTAFAAGADCGFWLAAAPADRADPRVRTGAVPADVLARAAVIAHVPDACDLTGLTELAALAVEVGAVHTPGARLYATRALNRCGLPLTEDPRDAGPVHRLFGGHERAAPAPFGRVDLDVLLPRLAH